MYVCGGGTCVWGVYMWEGGVGVCGVCMCVCRWCNECICVCGVMCVCTRDGNVR